MRLLYKLFLLFLGASALFAQVNLREAGARCDGTADDTDAFAALAEAAPANGVTFVLPAGLCVVRRNVTFPANSSLQVPRGAGLIADAGALITVQGDINAGSYPIFFGSGSISFSGNRTLSSVDAKWWGATGDGSTDDTVALDKAFRSAVTSSPSRLAFHLPSGVYRVCNLFFGNSSQNGCPTRSECSVPSRVYGNGGISYYGAVLQATNSCGANIGDFVAIANTTSKFTLENIRIDGNGTSNPGSGASCLDVSWKWSAAPASLNVYRHLMLSNCRDAAFSYAMNADSDNDADFQDIVIQGGSATGNQIGLSLIAPGGQATQLQSIKVYNKAVIQVDAQNVQIQDSYLTGGLIIGHTGSGGASNNNILLSNVQVEANPVSGFAFNASKPSSSAYAVQSLVCNSCYIAPSGLSSGQSVFSGHWLIGAIFNGGQVNTSGAGEVFGRISTPAGGYHPVFHFHHTFFTNRLPQPGSDYGLVLENVWNGANGTLVSTVPNTK